MTNLIVCRGMTKRAAAEDGPSFEQQFGILANALIADKYPKLDRMKLAFQLIDKDEDNSKALGVCVYVIGKNVVFVPAFFKNSKIRTGDMMFLAQSQQFLPLSDPWLSWIQDKDLQESGDIVSKEIDENGLNGSPVTVREITDPIVKTACVYLKGLLRTGDPLEKLDSGSILDTALKMGKTASAEMLTQLTDNVDFLNSALHFYSGDEIDGFAKKASAMWDEPADEVQVILPFTKEAKELNELETAALQRDGYLIRKTAASESPAVVRKSAIRKSFSTVSRPGKFKLLSMDGTVKEGLVMRRAHLDEYGCECIPCPAGPSTYGDPGPADIGLRSSYIFFAGRDDKGTRLPADAMMMAADGEASFERSMLDGYGLLATPDNVDKLDWDDLILCPNGTAYVFSHTVWAHNKGWISQNGEHTVTVAENGKQIAPVVTGSHTILPQGSRVVKRPDFATSADENANKGVHKIVPVVFSNLDNFLSAYTRKSFDSVKLTTDGGGEIEVSTGDGDIRLSIKEASLKLVKEHNIDPGVVRSMLHEIHAGAKPGQYKTETYLISKKAFEENGWEESPLAASEVQNKGDQQEQYPMPNISDNPEKLQQVAVAAAQNGIKEVFDVTALKLMVRQGNVLEEIHEDLPAMMKMLDSLCRKLFLLYWHTEEFEDRYGTVKLKSLEDSIKTTLGSLSELTIFFKLRNVDGNIGTGNGGGDLMEGHEL